MKTDLRVPSRAETTYFPPVVVVREGFSEEQSWDLNERLL